MATAVQFASSKSQRHCHWLACCWPLGSVAGYGSASGMAGDDHHCRHHSRGDHRGSGEALMANPQKAKGDRAELESAELLTSLLGVPVRRKLGAGRIDDTGDLDGVPGHVVQIANWADTAAAARVKPAEAEQQRINAQVDHAATLVRFRGGTWRVVLTLEQWARYVRCTAS